MESDHSSLADGGFEQRAGSGLIGEPDLVSGPDNEAPPARHNQRMETPEEARRSIIRWVGGMATFVIAAAVIGGLVLNVPYVALVPGSARDTEPLLAVEGIEQYPSDGELLFTTVRLRQRPNFWEYILLRLDGDAEVVPEVDILDDRTPEENRAFNLELMNNSKQIAVAVALEELGYDAVSTDAVVIQQLVAGEAAEGILEPGDSVLSIEGTPTPNTTALVETLGQFQPGDAIDLLVERFGAEGTETFTVVLGENPENAGSAFLGVQPADRLKFNEDFSFDVDIDSGSVGGPSAGLAFTLAILDQLTEGELTGGAEVAVTGTIRADGSVGAVGGVLQKTAAVRDLGVDAFIVPEQLGPDELAEIMAKADGKLEIIAVSDLEEALAALAELGGNVEAVSEFAAANETSG